MNKELIKNLLRFKFGITDCVAELLPPVIRDAIHRFQQETLAGLEEFLKEEQEKRRQEPSGGGVKPVIID